MQTISLIAAAAMNDTIGNKGKVPWHLPADFAYFKAKTKGHTIIMGRKTYESIGKPLPDRRNIVITRQTGYSALGCEVVASLPDALRLAGDGEIFIIGGSEIYDLALPLAHKIYLTRVEDEFPGDALFPKIDPKIWHVTETLPGVVDQKNPHPHTFYTYEKRK